MNKALSTIAALIIFSFINYHVGAQARVVKFNFLENLLKSNNDTTYVINFWATWCKPCVKELPYFEELKENYKNKKVSITLVSLDFKKDFETRLKPFLEQNKIKNRVVLLDEHDYNAWINKVDTTWGGGIPATMICQGNVKKFYEKDFSTYLELENVIKPFVK